MIRLPAASIVRLAAALLPAARRDWGRAMIAETAAIQPATTAFRFALGCLWAALSFRFSRREPAMPLTLIERPRRFAAACAFAAIGLGFAYMAAAGAPASYFAINGAAFLLGLLALGVLGEVGRLLSIPAGAVPLLLAMGLLTVSLTGISAEGVTRWIAVGGVLLQPSLILVPVLALSLARSRDAGSMLAIMVAALALALQPDRAMAGALLAAMAALALTRRQPRVLGALAAAALAFAITMIRPDRSPAMPFVDQIFFSSFGVHVLAGLAVTAGAVLMLAPALVGLGRDAGHRTAYAVFGAAWLAVILAAALGNYPTPLVGYGGSAILGYLISLIGLPARAATMPIVEHNAEEEAVAENGSLRASLA